MKTTPSFSEQVKHTLREINTIQKSIVEDESMNSLDVNVLEQCLLATKTKHSSGVRLSKSVPEKAAILLYELVTKKVVPRKNREITFIAWMLFLYQNGYWLSLPTREIKSLFMWIETSHALIQKQTIEGTRKIILAHLDLIN